MNDSYSAIYDAVRSRISGCNVSDAVHDVLRSADIHYQVSLATQEFVLAGLEMQRPSVVFRPRLFIDENKWCALYGDNVQDGVAGFGDSPLEAMIDFDAQWRKRLTQSTETAIEAN